MTEAIPTISVAVCVITYMRPQGLARVLGSLARLAFGKNPGVTPQIVVVDNDRAGSARPTVEAATAQMPWPIRYAVEPQTGISFARNRAVALADDCDYIAFLDDDEFAEPNWLDELLHAQRAYGAEIVVGPVLPVFETPPPGWLLRGRFVGVPRFDRARRPTGTPITYMSTANVLFTRRILASVAGPFNPRFALTGGSDTFLTMQLAQRGARPIWCDEALVHEVVPASRVSARWIIRRAYRVGNTISLCERELHPTARRLAERALRGGACITIGVAGLVPAALGGRATMVRMLTYAARGAGILAGIFGHRFEEYRTVHGS
jgi:GT2 family glycosyltransferase